jgi:hypothetical protein
LLPEFSYSCIIFHELTFDGREYGDELFLQVSGTEIFCLNFFENISVSVCNMNL